MIYFITAIHTDSGKTLVSAIVTQALGATYFKPIQAGLPTDSHTVKSLITNPLCSIAPERHRLSLPASPHLAALAAGIAISLNDFELPDFTQNLVVEGAGGILVPLNDTDFVIDLAARFKAQIILVSNAYLGSINHTLLTFSELQRRQLPVAGIVFNQTTDGSTEDIILKHTSSRCLLRIKNEPEITPQLVAMYAEELKKNL